MSIRRVGIQGYNTIGPSSPVSGGGGALGGSPGWWDPVGEGLNILAAYQPKSAADYASSKTNLANPGTYDAYEGNPPGWGALTGWTFNGTNDFLETGIVGTNTYSMIVQYSNMVAALGAIAGLTIGVAVRFNIYPKYSGDNNTYLRAGGSSNAAAPAGFAAGNWCVTPAQGYWNGAIFGAALAGAWVGATTAIIPIGGHRSHENTNPPDVNNYCPCYIQALAIYGATLTGAQVLSVATAMAAL